ncbi:IS1634 family transposase [Cuniculiplasma divulgatum]|uniref:IS1634 family transposase n=1 Tax=Cuniculiplasma divulgatum TaxID=1673428 RepID=A0A1N5WF16_9ARCH|nr:IS1634 family transposase [Cuniculiplasma divulgatum]SIM83878.1 IS1634 family transposase [Cuniculiplasma divulgatum]
MYVDVSKSTQYGKTYTRYLLRESYRDNGKVKQRTIANISHCSPEEIQAIRLALKYKGNLSDILKGKDDIQSSQGLSVGAVFSLYKVAQELGIVKAMGNTEEAKRVLWMILARLIEPGSRMANVRLAQRHAAVDVMGLNSFNEDDLYSAMDWIESNQRSIEKRLFSSRYEGNIPSLYLYDVTSSYLEGEKNEYAEFGYNRDKKRGKMQIVIGLLTDENGWPVSIEVFKGNTSDVKTFTSQIKKLASDFGCESVTMVGDRGMIKTEQIADLSEEKFYYITATTKAQMETLLKQKIIQMELFTEKLCEIENNGIRYILRRNPVRAEEIKDNRNKKIEKIRKTVDERNKYLSEHQKADVSTALSLVNERIEKLNVSGFISVEASGRTLTIKSDENALKEISLLDGCYVIRSNLPVNQGSKEIIHRRYRDLANVEWAFRTMKSDTIELRPIHVRKKSRTGDHVFIAMLSYIIEKHLREKWKDISITVEEGIHELSSINNIITKVDRVKYNQIPKPREMGSKLLNALSVTLPEAIPCSDTGVSTRKKLELKRKK